MISEKDPSTLDTHRFNHASEDLPNPLIKALDDFIIPIIRPGAPISLGVDRSQSRVEAQQLLVALEKYVASLQVAWAQDTSVLKGATVEASEPSEKEIDDTGLLETMEPVIADVDLSGSTALISTSITNEPPLLKEALERAHHHVFNKMPIRLLSFKPDGTGIELIERAVLWDRISPAIETDIHGFSVEDTPHIDGLISKHTKYAILSHTWLRGAAAGREVTYADWKNGSLNKGSAGYMKLANFCRIAAINHQTTLGWMDTVCINKDSSSELDESIRSMFKWYQDASICITYLAESTTLSDLRNDSWFSRGWTLQELLAPRFLKFYSANWQKIMDQGLENDKKNYLVHTEIQAATSITGTELANFQDSFYYTPISKRMQWAANRRVTREEDATYSLMGIFDVSIAIAYGEGAERAFVRLVKEIFSTSKHDQLDILNWGSGPVSCLNSETKVSCLIASSPKQYAWRANNHIDWPQSRTTPITLTHLGLQLPILLMPAILVDPDFPDLKCNPIGNYFASAIEIDIPWDAPDTFINGIHPGSHRIHILDKAANDWKGTNRVNRRGRIPFHIGVLNFWEDETWVHLQSRPSQCFAVALAESVESEILGRGLSKIPTSKAIVFNLEQTPNKSSYVAPMQTIPKRMLKKHGMHLVTTYL